MKAFNSLSSRVVPLNRANVDTDAIIPKQFLKSIKRSGFGPNLFDEWRYLDQGAPDKPNEGRPLNPSFVLNQAQFKNAAILMAQENFGCGSSREHAPWALEDYGFKVLLAPSFADIFYNNCFKNGILPVCLSQEAVNRLFELEQDKGLWCDVDLVEQSLEFFNEPSDSADRERLFKYTFDISPTRKNALLKGLDDIGVTLQQAELIDAFEKQYQKRFPWLFNAIVSE